MVVVLGRVCVKIALPLGKNILLNTNADTSAEAAEEHPLVGVAVGVTVASFLPGGAARSDNVV